MKEALGRCALLVVLLCALAGRVGASGPGCGYSKDEVLEAIKDDKGYTDEDGKAAVFKTVVFSGTALKGSTGQHITFRVLQLWKGKPQRYITIFPDWFEYDFKPGQKYLVYARNHAGRNTLDECTQTKPLVEAKEDLAILEEHFGPPVYAPNPLPLLLAAIGTTLTLGGGYYWRHKRS